MSDVTKQELSAFDEYLAAAPEPEKRRGKDDPVPDGDYAAAVDAATMERSKAGAPMIKWVLKIKGPACVGRLLWKRSVISEESMEFLKRDLCAVGLGRCKVSDLPDVLPRMTGVVLGVTVKSKGNNQNVYLNKVLEKAPARPAAGAARPAPAKPQAPAPQQGGEEPPAPDDDFRF